MTRTKSRAHLISHIHTAHSPCYILYIYFLRIHLQPEVIQCLETKYVVVPYVINTIHTTTIK